MSKKGMFFLMSLSCLSLYLSSSYAQNTESITISTYYPSPYGNYHEMRAQRVAIGDNYIFGDQYCWAPEACITTIAPDADLVVEGNVGVGTILPDSPLTIERQTGNAELHIQAADNFYNNWNGIRMRRARGSMSAKSLVQDQDDLSELNTQTWINNDWLNVASIEVRVDGTPNTNVPTKMVFHTATPNDPDMQERMVINSAGNVGIGTTNPGSKLSVHTNTNGIGPYFEGGDTNYARRLVISSSNTTNQGDTHTLNAESIIGVLAFATGGTERARVDSAGNVGIGTPIPAAKLHVSNGTLLVDGTGGSIGVGGIPFGGNRLQVYGPVGLGFPDFNSHFPYGGDNNAYVTGNNIILRGGSPQGWAEWLRVTSTGNVGIGTPDPGGYRLNVNGAIYTSGGCTGCSDARWKTNIMPISAPLDKIMALTGVQFNWRTKEYPRMFFQEGLDYGLVAQDVEKTLSEIVYEDNGYKYIRYDRLSAILIEATKEQQKEINQLKEELAQQKAELDSLKEKM